ncbi:hypothetical protein GEV33_012241 [Tenebrio molitor]|uniref:Reverse transcriptase n=1 Tax=Tenebrio molitor TaxID=7067 RepID=A0A8J6HA53_TENMO|nr:hypothetical protein GEV33_012241 [Tenebrio molitor]
MGVADPILRRDEQKDREFTSLPPGPAGVIVVSLAGVYAAMELIITPERLSREELTHELSARGTKVTDADGVDKLVHNLKYYLALESSGFCLKRAQDWTPTRVLDEANNSTIATKIAHLRKRLSRFAAEPGPQVEAKGELTADLNRAIDSFTTRVKFLAETPELSMRSGPPEFGATSSPRRTERVVEQTPSRSYHNWGQEIGSWSIVFKGDRCNDLAVFDFIVEVNERCASLGLRQDDLLRHAKLLFKGDALIWYRMVENRVSSWPDLCDRLKEEFLPIGYSDTARENLLRYRQTGGQSIGMFLARFEQLESYLPRPLPFPKKMTAILITRIDCGTRKSTLQTSYAQRRVQSHKDRAANASTAPKVTTSRPEEITCPRCKKTGHEVRDCQYARKIKCFGCGAVNVPVTLESRVGIFEVLVVPDVRHEMILGIEFWIGMGIVPNLRHLTWEFADSQADVTLLPPLINHLMTKDDLTAVQKSDLESSVKEYFNRTKNTLLGCTNVVQHKITLIEGAKPVRARNYRVSPFIQRLIDKEVDEMLKLGVIERAESEWNSPYLMVPKKDGSYRFVIDFRGVNARSKRMCYPVPNISHILNNLGNAKYLSSLDIRSAYWEVPLEEGSRPLTAFSIPERGQFQFRRRPFGLHSAPGTFQALVDKLFTPDLEPYVFAYLDDIIISTPDFETHRRILKTVFDKLSEAGLTLKESKCEFCKPELRYLGYVVNRRGLNVDPAKVSAVVDMPPPKGVRDVRRLIGMMSWKSTHFTFTVECEQAFTDVKNALVNAPILSCPDFDHPFTLQCDTSDVGIGAVLTQNINGQEHVICYLSQKKGIRTLECVTVTSSRGLNVVTGSSTRSGSGWYRRVREMSCSNGIMTTQPRPYLAPDESGRVSLRPEICASVKPEQRPPAGTMGSRPEISHPWQMISADLFGPLPRSTNGHEYVLVITDYFSKFPLFVPVRSPTARKVIDEIERRVFLMFGVPEFIIVDNGVQFGRSREFQNFLNNYGVKPYYNSLYTLQNNPTERVNRTMKSLIVSYTDQDQRKWDENLDRVACALRTAKHEATKQTPYLLNFGNKMIDHGTGHELRRTRESLDDGAEANPLGEQVTESKLDKVRRVVTGLINRYRDRAKRYYDAKRREVEYAVGDLVWKRSYPTTDGTKHFSAKLAKPFVGPFTITERLDHTRESEDDRDSSFPEFTEYEDSDGGSDTSSNE